MITDDEKAHQMSHRMTAETIDSFISKETECGASENMIRRYNCTVKAVFDFLPDDKIITRERLLQWRQSMEESGYASMTILNYVKNINRYLDHVGCSEIRFNRGKAKDIADMTFGYLTAIEPTGAKKRGDIVWLCRCRCGNTVELPATRLLRNNTLSCGCLHREHFKRANKTIENTNLRQALNDQTVSTRAASGYVGVSPKRDKWQAHITYKGKRYSLGCYSHIEDAVKARARAKEMVMEDAAKLLELYEEIHKFDTDLPNSKTEPKKHFPSSTIQINNKPASAAKRTDNTSGHVGVYSRRDRWEARICYEGVRYMLGLFDEMDEAISQRRRAEALLKEDPREFVRYYSLNCRHYRYSKG